MGTMLLLLYFQPFGINFLSSPKDGYFVLAIGLLSAAIFFFSTQILPGLFPTIFNSEQWTIKKELMWNTGMFILLVVGFAFSAKLLDIKIIQPLTIFRSGELALLPLVLFNLVNYNRLLKAKVVQMIGSGRHWLAEEKKDTQQTTEEEIQIASENGKDIFIGKLKNLVLIQSASNYIEIFYRDGSIVRKQMIRQTLNKVEKNLSAFENFKKCHRCCLVNINQVVKLTGSSTNYSLEIKGLNFHIPVSRQNIALFKKLQFSV
jgi:hypothetical protein